MVTAPKLHHTKKVPSWGSFSYAFGPLVAAGVITLFVVLLKWAFRRGNSLIAAPATPGNPDDYGLLVPVASPATYIEGELLRRTLEEAGVRSSLAQTNVGPRVMVWPADEKQARALLKKGPR